MTKTHEDFMRAATLCLAGMLLFWVAYLLFTGYFGEDARQGFCLFWRLDCK